MHSWEVVCIERDSDRGAGPRSITALGLSVAAGFRMRDVEVVHQQCMDEERDYHITVDGDTRPLVPDREDGIRYVHTTGAGDAGDPLLDLPTREEYTTESAIPE